MGGTGRWDTPTIGHGIFSQFASEHHKQWVQRETRRQEKSTTTRRGSHIEILHDRGVKPLRELRTLTDAPPSTSLGGPLTGTAGKSPKLASTLRPYKAETSAGGDIYDMKPVTLPSPKAGPAASPGGKLYPPHLVHHHHFGWQGPPSEAPVASDRSRANKTYGHAMGYCEEIQTKHSLLCAKDA